MDNRDMIVQMQVDHVTIEAKKVVDFNALQA